MRQRFPHNRIAPYLILAAATFLGGFLYLPSAHAAIVSVTSNITSNTTWGSGNTYVVNNFMVDISPGVTLTIASGTSVKFQGIYAGIQVDGTLNAIGDPSNKIYFTSYNDNSAGSTTPSSTGAIFRTSTPII